ADPRVGIADREEERVVGADREVENERDETVEDRDCARLLAVDGVDDPREREPNLKADELSRRLERCDRDLRGESEERADEELAGDQPRVAARAGGCVEPGGGARTAASRRGGGRDDRPQDPGQRDREDDAEAHRDQVGAQEREERHDAADPREDRREGGQIERGDEHCGRVVRHPTIPGMLAKTRVVYETIMWRTQLSESRSAASTAAIFGTVWSV